MDFDLARESTFENDWGIFDKEVVNKMLLTQKISDLTSLKIKKIEIKSV